MLEKLNKIRKENPDFDEKFINKFAKKSPELLNVMLDGEIYHDHIGSKDVAQIAEKYITNNKGNNIGFHWDYEAVMNAARSFIELNDAEFYPTDLWVWANVKYGDLAHIITDTTNIIRIAISELTDEDYPYFNASKRAYYWLLKHVENNK